MLKETLEEAKKLLETVTPLKTDCGLLCDRACCEGGNAAGEGVWLFPGEEETDMPWGFMRDTRLPVTGTRTKILICEDFCKRESRPLQCRIFPLVPYFSKKNNEWTVRMDRRAYMLCPLCNYGKKGLNPEFVNAAKLAVQKIAEDEAGERFLQALAREEDAYRIEL